MVTLDANLLIYAYDTESEFFLAASRWLEARLSTSEAFGIPIQVLLAFLRILTNPALPRRVYTVDEALRILHDLLARPQVYILSPGPDHWLIFERLYRASGGTGRMSTDVHIATLALEHDALLFFR